MIRAVARRAKLPVILLGGVVVIFAGVAVLTGSSVQRGLSLGFYAVGSFLTVVGFALGTRNAFRSAERRDLHGRDRFADLWETTEAAALLIAMGLVLLVVGVAVDERVRLI